MKSYSAEALAGLTSGEVTVSAAVYIATTPPTRVWGGHGPITIDGQVFAGIGDAGLVSTSAGVLGAEAQGTELSLSGVDPVVLATVDLEALRGLPVVIWRLVFNGTGARILAAHVWQRGAIDTATSEAVPGGTSTIKIMVEGAARGLGRRSERMRSDADQRLISPTDGGMRHVVHAGEKTIYFGGQKPQRAGTALGASPDADLLSRMKR